jgi:hypothetical protein
MSQTPVLLEPSFADAIAIIAASDELPKQTQRHWTTSLRQVAKALDKPLQTIPARLRAVRADLARLHHAPAGLTLKTLRNHKSNVKSALRWLARERGVPEHGAPLMAAWEELRAQISDRFVRWRLSSFILCGSAPRTVLRRPRWTRSSSGASWAIERKPGVLPTIDPGVGWSERGIPMSEMSGAGRCGGSGNRR